MYKKIKNRLTKGSVLSLVVVVIVLLSIAGLGLLQVSSGMSHQASITRCEALAVAAAEAGYEKAVFWMSQQMDMLSAISQGASGLTGNLLFSDSSCDYKIDFASFISANPIYKITSVGTSGTFGRTIEAYVTQAIGGWEMGMCRVPGSPAGTYPVNFVSGELIDIPIHINNLNDSPDERDIYIIGSPTFLALVSMGESRYTAGGADKYATVKNMFQGGIAFDQPSSRITDADSVRLKVERFADTTDAAYKFTPTANPAIASGKGMPAVQLEFVVGSDGNGYVRITKDCTVVGYKRSGSDTNSWDYIIDPAGDGTTYTKYNTYGYHYIPSDPAKRYIVRTDNPDDSLYVTQSYGGVDGQPGGQIYVDGNVLIGCKSEDAPAFAQLNSVKGKITVVATGNIWLTNELKVAGSHEADGMPSLTNPNVIGLVTQKVVKVVDAGMTTNGLLAVPAATAGGDTYEPIALKDRPPSTQTYDRELPAQMVVEAAVTIGGGGWGAENVYRGDMDTDRENYNGNSFDELIVRGTITEAIRGVVGSEVSFSYKNGYKKYYYHDKRLLSGILPGNIWLKGKYIPIPAGWVDYRTED